MNNLVFYFDFSLILEKNKSQGFLFGWLVFKEMKDSKNLPKIVMAEFISPLTVAWTKALCTKMITDVAIQSKEADKCFQRATNPSSMKCSLPTVLAQQG